MKKGLKFSLIGLAAAGVAAGGGFGGWYAWDNGLVGENPRAPTPQAMEKAVRLQAAYVGMTSGNRTPCVNVDLAGPQPEVRGEPGIAFAAVPGQHSVTMLLQTNARTQPARDAQLEKYGYLAGQGLLTAGDTTITTDDGTGRPARHFKLTWKGWASLHASYGGGSLCLNYGKREFDGIEKIEKTAETMMDHAVYEVTYKSSIKALPAWAASPEARRLFAKLDELTDDRREKVKVLRTKEGWRSAHELEIELAVASKGGDNPQQAALLRRNMMRQIEQKAPLSAEEAARLLAGYKADQERSGNPGLGCFPLSLQRSLPGLNDEKDAPGPLVPQDAEFTLALFDRGDRKPYEYQNVAKALHVLSALEGAGLAKMEEIRPAAPPPPPPRAAVRRPSPTPIEPPRPLGVRFTVGKEAMAEMGISRNGGGCIPVGRLKTEILAVNTLNEAAQSSLLVRAVAEQTPAWVARIAERLPSLKSILDNGLALQGTTYPSDEEANAGRMKLGSLYPRYPTLSYESIPAHLAPLMPLTAAAYAAKPLKAPGVAPELLVAPSAPAILSVQPAPAPPLPAERRLAAPAPAPAAAPAAPVRP